MSKLSITDPTIRVKPGPRMATFIVNLTDPIALPENVLKIYQSFGGDASVEHTKHQTEVPKPSLGPSDLELLGKLDRNEIGGDVQTELAKLISTEDEEIEDIEADHDDDDGKPLSKSEAKRLKEKQKEQQRSKLTLNLNDLKWLNELLVERRKLDGDDQQQYLHWLMADATLVLPSNEIRVRNPELEARCVRLRLEQNARVYNAMTRNVDTSRRLIPDDTIAFQMKQINRHLIAVLQFLFSVAAGFAFGFIGVELIVGGLDFGFRLLLGIICALVIALAEIYFLAKHLNEEYDLATSDRVQLHQAPPVGRKTPLAAQPVVAATKGGKEHSE